MGDATGTYGRPRNGPRSSWSVFGAPWGSFWVTPGRSWRARGAPRLALGRHLGVQKPSRARPDASPKRPWAPKTAQDRFFFDFGSIWGGWSSIFERLFVDFRSSRARRRHKSRISKRSRAILSARLGSCVVQSLRIAALSLVHLSQWLANITCASFFSLRTHKPT